jgi:D-alanyl-lipoteichoic acid acyltransferase DltB (MBOAT superfamily)
LTFTSFEFLLFLPLVVALYWVCPVRLRILFLLLLSYAFYCTWSVKAAIALAAMTVVTFFAGKCIGDAASEHRAGITAFFAIVLLTGYLAFFKIAAIVSIPGLGRLVMPLGVSFYTFKLLSYVIDVYWGKIEPTPHLLPFAASIAFFPQIVAGPIQRPADFLGQLPPSRVMISKGLPRLVWGIAKKVLVADNLAPAATYVFGRVKGLHAGELLAGFYLFPLQLYADFSALTDIAVGMGLLFGIEGPENFNRPFTASSISQFWRRWHMSLTRWLADYLFTPLRMATRSAGTAGLAFSITLNMLAIALWHGLTLGYLVFGLINAAYLVADAVTLGQRGRFFKAHPKLDGLGSWLGWLLTLHVVFIALVFFRARTNSDAIWLLSHAWRGLGSARSDLAQLAAAVGARSLAVAVAGYTVLELAERYRPDNWWRRVEPTVPAWVQWSVQVAFIVAVAVGLFMLTVRAVGQQSPFLYQVF